MAMLWLKGFVLLGVALLVGQAWHRASAAVHRSVLAIAIVGALALPGLAAVLPGWSIQGANESLVIPEFTGVEREVEALSPAGATREIRSAPIADERHGSDLGAGPWWLFLGWIGGVLLFGLRFVVGVVRVRRLVRDAIPSPRMERALDELVRELGMRRRVRLRLSDKASGPLLAGWWRPTVVLPREAEQWPASRLRMVWLHELAHVQGQDAGINLVGQMLCCLRWLDPLSWLAVRRYREACERRADDFVIGAGVRPSEYATELLALSRAARMGNSASFGMAHGGALRSRIVAILGAGRRRTSMTWRGLALLLGSSLPVLALLACAGASEHGSALRGLSAAKVGATAFPTRTASSIQGIVDREIRRLAVRWRPRSASVLVLDARTSQVLGSGQHGEALDRRFEPGSTIKPLAVAGALEKGMRPQERFFCENGRYRYRDRVFSDHASFGWLTVGEILERSSNIGAIKILERVGAGELRTLIRQLGFTRLPPLADWRRARGAFLAMGHSLYVKPIEVAGAYAALANGGVYRRPWSSGSAPSGRRVMRATTARTVLELLEGVVHSQNGTGRRARVPGLTVAGKTGTALLPYRSASGRRARYVSFAGVVPSTNPRYVVHVALEAPEKGGTGGQVAAPSFARITHNLLH